MLVKCPLCETERECEPGTNRCSCGTRFRVSEDGKTSVVGYSSRSKPQRSGSRFRNCCLAIVCVAVCLVSFWIYFIVPFVRKMCERNSYRPGYREPGQVVIPTVGDDPKINVNQTTNGVGYTLGDDSAVDPETKESKPVGKGAEVTFSEDGRTLVKAPEDVTSFDVPDGVTRIGSNAFRECTQLTRITLPDSVKEIGTCAFWNCTALTSISFPAGLREIHGDSFAGCTSLTEIEIPEECAEVVRKAYPRWFQEADPQ